jgi:hypothetical protein
MAGESSVTTDHEVIRKWVEERKGRPATVKGTDDEKRAGLLRIFYQDYHGKESLKEITWEEFFEKFEEKELAFLYQEKTKSGAISRFSKFVSRKRNGGSDGKSKNDKSDNKRVKAGKLRSASSD